MKQVLIIQTVQCNNCQYAIAVNGAICDTVDTVESMASQLHANSKVICVKPQLIIAYANGLVSDSLFEKKSAILPSNGHSV